MKSIAIIFSHSPFGNFLSKDGLDFSISLTAYSKKIEIFFIGDGVFQCLKNKNSNYIYCYDYTQRFKILKTLGVKKFYCDQSSLESRGLLNIKNFIVTMNILNTKNFINKLSFFDHILNF
ncbi:MAG: sulfurtransferase complex subunit TusC [Buchnera aphidicola (Periphyllus acericola)]|uniref:sulfurtransferase complex subunit TusC n=1 Tax=Buchnera aphidicola TaxID=9 RepID=UPI0030CBBBAE|nr:sulfurtransferase complex subunit TusC [Buchnera aphidicola (Periphyllus acericola)]